MGKERKTMKTKERKRIEKERQIMEKEREKQIKISVKNGK